MQSIIVEVEGYEADDFYQLIGKRVAAVAPAYQSSDP